MKSIVVVGSLNMDLVVQVQEFPKPGETMLATSFAQNHGGKGGNQAVAAGRAGGNVTLLAAVGDDDFGTELTSNLKKEGIETQYLLQQKGLSSGLAMIQVDRRGQNTIVVNPGANAALQPDQLLSAQSILSGAGILLVSLEIPMQTVEWVLEMSGPETITILNPAPAFPFSAKLINRLDWITPNETETEILTGIIPFDLESMKLATTHFHHLGVKNVIITLGETGAFVSTQKEQFLVPAPKIKAVDTTAAGDVFNGCFASALAEGMAPKDASRFAVQAASLSVTRQGAQQSAPYRNEI